MDIKFYFFAFLLLFICVDTAQAQHPTQGLLKIKLDTDIKVEDLKKMYDVNGKMIIKKYYERQNLRPKYSIVLFA